MGDKTGIEWTDATWNPVTGCSKVSQGCKHCYAERVFPRPYPGRAFTDVQTHPERLDQPLRWKRPRRIFVNSMSDLFHEAVPDDFIDLVFAVMGGCEDADLGHTFQILTKRPERMQQYMKTRAHAAWNRQRMAPKAFPPNNVWLGVSVEDQATADERIPILLQTPAAVRWISAEPLLGPVDLYRGGWSFLSSLNPPPGNKGGWSRGLDWVVVGGESGPKARPMHPVWARSLRDQCIAAGVPFLFKQWGEWSPAKTGDSISDGLWMHGNGNTFGPVEGESFHPAPLSTHIVRTGKKASGRMLDGNVFDEYPD